MSPTREEYRQWHDTYWVGASKAVGDVVERFKETQTTLENRDTARFITLTADDSADGLRQTTIVAENLVSKAEGKLKEVMFTEKQRQKRPLDLVSIPQLDELAFVMANVSEDLVRGVRLEHEAVKEDAAQLATVADGSLPKRLSDTLYTITASLASTEQAVDALAGRAEEGAEEEEEGDEEVASARTDLTVSAPMAVDMSKDRVDVAVVDKWNEQVLKTLSEGSSTAFYQIDDLIIIDANQAAGAQPYVEWAKQQKEIVPDATITLVKKGGAFDPGAIRAGGVKDRVSFEAAIKRISKKKVNY